MIFTLLVLYIKKFIARVLDHIPISKEVNFNHFIVLTGWLLQRGRGKAAPSFLVHDEANADTVP